MLLQGLADVKALSIIQAGSEQLLRGLLTVIVRAQS